MPEISKEVPKVRVKLPPRKTAKEQLVCKCCGGGVDACNCVGCNACLNIPCSC